MDAKNSFDGYIHSMWSATEVSDENKVASDKKLDLDELENIVDVLMDARTTRTLFQPSKDARKGGACVDPY